MGAVKSKTINQRKGMTWLIFALMTVAAWGVYGIFLHKGAVGMGDPENGRYKAFLWVGIAYFVTAVAAPFLLLLIKGASWSMPSSGITYSFIAGIVGAIGAFGVLLAFGAKGHPAVVMAIIFAGAPVVNALISISIDPPPGGIASVPKLFWLGVTMAAVGGCIVTKFKPQGSKPHGPPPEVKSVQ